MLPGLARARLSSTARSSSIYSHTTLAKHSLLAAQKIQTTVRYKSSKPDPNPNYVSRRWFRTNGQHQAEVSRFPRLNESFNTIVAAETEAETEAESSGGHLPLTIPYMPGRSIYEISGKPRYWQAIPRWKDITHDPWLTDGWHVAQTVHTLEKLKDFLIDTMPRVIPEHAGFEGITTREAFIDDVEQGIKMAPMTIKLPPHVLSLINWSDPISDPIRRQFIPMKSGMLKNHRMSAQLGIDSLHEVDDMPVNAAGEKIDGLVHRYPDKALFLATSICPLYCRFCTRAFAIGLDTPTVMKRKFPPGRSRWDKILEYIENTPQLRDIVVSGGDSYMLNAMQLRKIGERLISIPHIRRFRFATKGLAISPAKILDESDPWTSEMIRLSQKAREYGKDMAIHTHFNHPREITWVTELALLKLFQNHVTVRNQSVLLRGVNDNVPTMSKLIHMLADNNVRPMYVYQGDMIPGSEDLRTPLETSLNLERQLRGTIGGMNMPDFVVDLPGGGGKRSVTSFDSYDRTTGRSTFTAPGITRNGKEGKVYEYWDPEHSLPHKEK